MESSDTFYLKWDEFEANFKSNYKQLRQEEDFCDVTLVSDDDKHIEAHKLVLASASSCFRDIIKKTKQVHPLLYLRGVKSLELTQMLDFIYHGEVKVPQADLQKFLEVAQDFGVTGLMDNFVSMPDSGSDRRNTKIKKQVKQEVQETYLPEPYPFNLDFINDNIQFDDIIGEEIIGEVQANEEVISSVVELDEGNLVLNNSNLVFDNSAAKDEIDEKVEDMIFSESGCWGCKKCGKVMKKKQHIKNHAESHLEGYSHPCPICGKSSKTRNALQNHISYFHKHPMAKVPLTFM